MPADKKPRGRPRKDKASAKREPNLPGKPDLATEPVAAAFYDYDILSGKPIRPTGSGGGRTEPATNGNDAYGAVKDSQLALIARLSYMLDDAELAVAAYDYVVLGNYRSRDRLRDKLKGVKT